MTRTRRQIEMHHQGEASIEVRDAAGRSCAGVFVWTEQEPHASCSAALPPTWKRCRIRVPYNRTPFWLDGTASRSEIVKESEDEFDPECNEERGETVRPKGRIIGPARNGS